MISTAESKAFEQRRTPIIELIAVIFFVLSLGLLGYLIYALLRAEEF